MSLASGSNTDDARRHFLVAAATATGESVIDHVCHDVVQVRDSALQRQWNEDTFYFCSPFCRRRFDAEPTTYLLAPNDERDASACCGNDHATA